MPNSDTGNAAGIFGKQVGWFGIIRPRLPIAVSGSDETPSYSAYPMPPAGSLPAPHLPERFASATFENYFAQNPGQVFAREKAERLAASIRARFGRRQRVRRWLRLPPPRKPNGIYLVGPVGTGKTHLMAAMYHALMPDVPTAFFHTSHVTRSAAHPEQMARSLAAAYRVVCLDEVEIDDPANEARLVLLFKSLEAAGVVLLATSNVEPERFLAAEFGADRFRRFLSQEFRQTHDVIVVDGEDYRRRQAKTGRAWIGDPGPAKAAMQLLYDTDRRPKRWIAYADLIRETVEKPHARLMASLAPYGSLYIAGIAIKDSDDALRLLRVVDDLYMQPAPPVLYFTAERPPEAWFTHEQAASRLSMGVAVKFERTVSRLRSFCELEAVGAA